MATYVCVVLFAVAVTAILANSTNVHENKNNFENLEENSSISSRAQPLQSSKKKEIKEEYQKLLQKTSENSSRADIESEEDFWEERNKLADLEVEKLLGNGLPLEKKELEANQIILGRKYEEYEKTLSRTEIFPPSISFLKAKRLIEDSEIYKIIKKLPKGANLYGMLLTSVDLDFIYELTFENNLYFRFEETLKLQYSRKRPDPSWRLLSQLRGSNNSEYVEDLNNAVKQSLTFTLPEAEFKEIRAWDQLITVLQVHYDIATYKSNFVKIFRRALEILYEDNVMYAELRYDFPDLYDLDGRIYNGVAVLKLCKTLIDEFVRTHKDFVGVRFIYAPIHGLNSSRINEFREKATALWKANPTLIAGFGFIRVEDGKEPYSDWVEDLLKFPKEMKVFLNAGLTNNWGTDADYNILDGLILNSVRIGDGFSLNKHPVILEQLRQNYIAVEFSPIMDQVLGYVKDLRNHPHALLISTDFPIVVGNTGGTFWDNTGLSYEWYEVYMGLTPKFCDIRCLKQLAINSWLYSSLPIDEKKKNIQAWEVLWDKFIDYIISTYVKM